MPVCAGQVHLRLRVALIRKAMSPGEPYLFI